MRTARRYRGVRIELLEPRRLLSISPALSINSVTQNEPLSGSSNFVFTVSLSCASTKTVSVNYATADGTAKTSSHDYVKTSGKLSFAPGVTSATVAVPVLSDNLVEPNETFYVKLSGQTNATIKVGTGVGTITDIVAVSPVSISINSVTQSEPTSQTSNFVFTVSLAAASNSTVSVNYATADGTATVADGDYLPVAGTLTFAPGATTQTISVPVEGGNLLGANEIFYVNLSSPTNGTLATPQGVGTIIMPVPVSAVTVTTPGMYSFTELSIAAGTSAGVTIVLSQSGSTYTITANGVSQQITGTFGDIKIYGGAGNDTITVLSSVWEPTLIYGGGGTDSLTDYGTGQATIVSIGDGGADILTGNGFNTDYWALTSDTINASSAEIAAGDVNRVASFYQPWSTDPSNPNYIPLSLNGQNLADPTDTSSSTFHMTNRSLWGTGPVISDINQGSIGDCGFLADLASLASSCPGRLEQTAVDLGDGTYCVRFIRNGVTSFVRVDCDLDLLTGSTGATGDVWGLVFEKAYAFFYLAQNTYGSLNACSIASWQDLGFAESTWSPWTSAGSLYNAITGALNTGDGLVVAVGTPADGASLIADHAYSVVGAGYDSSGNLLITLRNPWGFDGAGSDSNPGDGLVTVTLAQFQSSVYDASMGS